MILSLALLACGGLSESEGTAPPVVDADVSDEAADAGYDRSDLDDDGREDGVDDPILGIQAETLVIDGYPNDLPMICGHESIRMFTNVSVLGAYGLGGDDDWNSQAVGADRLRIEGAEYDCFVTIDNGQEYEGGGRNPSTECDQDTDPDYQSPQCWWIQYEAARGDELIHYKEYNDSYVLDWTVVGNVLYGGDVNGF